MVLFLALLGLCQFLTTPRANIFPASCGVLDLSGADYPMWRVPALVSSLLPISSTEKCRLYLVHRGGRFWHLDRAAIFP